MNEQAEKMPECLRQPNVYARHILTKSYAGTFDAAPLAQIYHLCKTKLLLSCTIFSFQLSRQPVFQELFSKSPPQLRHTLQHNSLQLKIAPCEATQALVNTQKGTPTGDNGQQGRRWLRLYFLRGVVQRFTDANLEAEQKTEKRLKWCFHCPRAQTVTEASPGKNTRLSWWKQEHDTTDRRHQEPDHSSLSTVGSQRDSAPYWPRNDTNRLLGQIMTSYRHIFMRLICFICIYAARSLVFSMRFLM